MEDITRALAWMAILMATGATAYAFHFKYRLFRSIDELSEQVEDLNRVVSSVKSALEYKASKKVTEDNRKLINELASHHGLTVGEKHKEYPYGGVHLGSYPEIRAKTETEKEIEEVEKRLNELKGNTDVPWEMD